MIFCPVIHSNIHPRVLLFFKITKTYLILLGSLNNLRLLFFDP